ncbi:MAG: hypothetical protein WDW38_008584 [Sanguina aurantia]
MQCKFTSKASTRHGLVAVQQRQVVCSGIRARWCLDARYGQKSEATALLQEWVRDIGSLAGCNTENTRLSSGAIGAPESRLELEVNLEGGMASWDEFLSRIPSTNHRAWSQRIQSMVVDGSPTWQIYREVPVLAFENAAEGSSAASSDSSSSRKSSSSSSSSGNSSRSSYVEPSQGWTAAAPAQLSWPVPEPVEELPKELPQLMIVDSIDSAEVILDWKGDPMKWNPGDSLGGKKFL